MLCQGCARSPFWDKDRKQVGSGLQVYNMLVPYQGTYVCKVDYTWRRRSLSFTRSINVTAVCEAKQYHS